jgi:hypothetical protein
MFTSEGASAFPTYSCATPFKAIAMPSPMRRTYLFIGLLGFFLISALLALNLRVREDEIIKSPKGAYYISFIKASQIDRWRNPNYEMPRFVELYEVKTGKRLYKSELVELANNGDVRWYLQDQNQVTVGVDVQFESVPAE